MISFVKGKTEISLDRPDQWTPGEFRGQYDTKDLEKIFRHKYQP